MLSNIFAPYNALPIILQAEASECGLACIAMISSYHGQKVDLSTLRQHFPVSSSGATIDQLMEIAERIDLRTRPLKLELRELKELQLPAILHWDLKHFVVLKKVKGRHCIIHDPGVGVRKYTLAELNHRFTGVALELAPGTGFAKADVTQIPKLFDLFVIPKGFYITMAQIFALSLIFQVAQLFMPFYMMLSLDIGLTMRDNDLLMVITIGFLLVTLSKVAVEFIRARAITYFTNQVGFQIANNIYFHLIRLPIEFFERRNLNDLITKVDSVNQIRDVITRDIVGVLVDGIFSLTALVLMFYLSPSLTAIGLFAISIFIGYKFWARSADKNQFLTVMEERRNHQAEVLSTLRSIRAIKIQCNEQRRFSAWQTAYSKLLNAEINSERSKSKSEAIRGLIFGIDLVLVIYLANHAMNNRELSMGQFVAYMMLKQQFVAAFVGMIPKIMEYRGLRRQLSRLADITHTPTEFQHFSFKPFRKPLNGGITLDSISYTYPGQATKAVNDVSIQVAPGEILGLHGPSGSGKSTLMKIMTGIVKPTSGSVLVNDMPIDRYGMREYRNSVAAIYHSNAILPGSILFNITLKLNDVDMQRVEQICKLTQIHDHISSLSMGYQSLVGDMEASISAGQIQRIILARALYKEPKLLFLDEAMSNLDEEMAKSILASISELGITIIMASHSVKLLSSAQRILFIKEGKISSAPVTSELAEQAAQEVSATGS